MKLEERTKLVDIFNETDFISGGLEDTVTLLNNVVVYTEFEPDIQTVPSHYTPISIVNGGTVSVGYALAKEFDNVAVLNFADDVTPGGLVLSGEVTQEENICRCTNLYRALTHPVCELSYYQYNVQFKGLGSDRVIYAPKVRVFRDDVDYHFIEPRYFDVITCPAPSIRVSDDEIFTVRITKIINSAIKNNVDCIVLGAWGCGAFGQNPNRIAKAFADVLNVYSDYFKKIVFAIRTNDAGYSINSDIFYTELNANFKGEVVRDAIR